MKKIPLHAIAIVLSLLVGGCGYRIGSLMHPQIKSIAIAPVTNETVVYNVGPQVRGLLCETFQQDGSLQLKRESNADCVLYARVFSIKFNQMAWSNNYENENYVPTQWNVIVELEYSVVIPGELKPLISKRKASGQATFMTGADMETGRMSGIRQAAYEASKKVVAQVTEGW